MTYLLLPSARLAIYEALAKKIKVLPIKAEEIVVFGEGNQEKVVLSYQKSISIYESANLKASTTNNPNPLSSSIFNKKLQGLTHNNKGLTFVSDKFGDVYSVDVTGQTKYLNSNLGIPTFLSYLNTSNKSYIIVGDEDTRIKIYNEQRMHEIKAFWFLTKRVPLQLKQASQGHLLLLLKKQNNNFNNSEQSKQNFVEVYELPTHNIEAAQFQGKLLYVSEQIEQNQQCKYQHLITHYNSNAYLLKLFSNKIKILTFNCKDNHYQFTSSKELETVEGDWDSLDAYIISVENQQEIVISYGKSQLQQDLEVNTQPYDKDLLSFQQSWRCSVNPSEHLIVHKL